MKHLNRIIIIITFSTLAICCSHKQQTTSTNPEEANLYSLTTYRNIYNKYGKLETVFINEKSFSTANSSSSSELHFTYKNDTVLIREETYDILSDGSKVLISHCIYDENFEKYIRFNNQDTVMQISSQYKNGLIVNNRIINTKKHSLENSETFLSYDSEKRVSQIKTINHDNGTTTSETYKYDMAGDTLITYISVDNILNRTEKKIENGDYSIELFYNEQNHLVRETTHKKIDQENNVRVNKHYEQNQLDSTFYYLGKEVKTIMTELEHDTNLISPEELNKNDVYTLEELLNIFANHNEKQTILFEYDEFGNITKEAWYVEEREIDK